MNKTKLKKYTVFLSHIEDGDEMKVFAKNKDEARKKAKKQMHEEEIDFDYYISEIVEEKNE